MDYGMPFLLETAAPADAAALCASLGLRFVELNASFPPCQPERLDPAQLRSLMAQYGIYFTLHAHEELDPFSDNAAVRSAWLQTLEHTLALAVALNMPTVNMHLARGVYITLPDRRVYLYDAYAQDYQQNAEALTALAERMLAGTNTMLCIENTEGFAPHEQRLLEQLLRSPCIGLTLDIGHSHARNDADIPFYQAHSDKLRHMHGHDARGKRNHQALGDGEIDLVSRFTWAKQSSARVVLETKTIAALRQSIAWLANHPDLL